MASVTGNGFDKRPQDINRKGRPSKEYCLTDILKEQGEWKDVDTEEGMISRKDAIAKKLWSMAMSGDIVALKYVYDRIDGKPLQQIEAKVEKTDRLDKSKYTKEELKQLAELNRRNRS